MKKIDLNTWERKSHYEHFRALKDPYFGVTIPFNVSKAHQFSKINKISFFGKYLHDCMKAINEVDELKLRIIDEEVVKYDRINASATLMRSNKTFGFSYIEFDDNLNQFIEHLELEKNRIEHSNSLYPLRNDDACIHCSALPWLAFSGHKEPVSGSIDSVPKIAFSKIIINEEEQMIMNVSVNVNHALVDGYHLSLFSEKFQHYLNK